MRRKRAMERMKRIALVLLTLLCFGLMIFCLYIIWKTNNIKGHRILLCVSP